jgi:O-antigen/teichoic acid export membrane protein
VASGPSVRRNIFANAFGQGWTLLLGIALIPVYIRLMGVESYGLVGLFVTVQAALMVLDFGLAATVNRELARGTQDAITAGQMRNLVRTFEWLYWPIAVVIACLTLLFASTLSAKWLNPVELSASEVGRALTLMGLVAAAQWPSSLYSGGLAGLQRQGILNALVVVFATLRSAGVIVPLILIEPSITVFFAWQLAVSVAQTAVFAAALWRAMPRGDRPVFSRAEATRVSSFAGGVAGMAATSFVLLQFDRVVLASLLDLKSFGYYATAAALATAIPRLVQPVSTAVYPRYSQLVVGRDEDRLRELYHKTNQAVAVLLATVGVIACVYSESLLLMWTASPDVAASAGHILKLLAAASVLGALASLPYSLQLAYGNTRLSLSLSVLGICIYVPALWFAANAHGAIGAATTWLGLNAVLLIAGVSLMHRKMLLGSQARWYMRDVLPVFAVALGAGLAVQALWPALPRSLGGLALLVIATAVVGSAALLAARDVRAEAIEVVSAFIRRRPASRQR